MRCKHWLDEGECYLCKGGKQTIQKTSPIVDSVKFIEFFEMVHNSGSRVWEKNHTQFVNFPGDYGGDNE